MNKKRALIFLFGDIVIFYATLWLMLAIRYAEIPTRDIVSSHIPSFTILFVCWIVYFYISGLYDKRTPFLKKKLIGTILHAEIVNIIIAVLFFYFIPYFGITPKTNLFIYLVISCIGILIWRLYGPSCVGVYKNRKNALLVGSGNEAAEIIREVNTNDRYNITFVSVLNSDMDTTEEKIKEIVKEKHIEVIVLDLQDVSAYPFLSHMYSLIFSHVEFVDISKLYEELFDCIPLSIVRCTWFLEHASSTSRFSYDLIKRLMDIGVSIVAGIPTLIIFPFIACLIKLEDGGPIFVNQKRVGKNNRLISVYKFRTMTGDDGGNDTPDTTLRDTMIGPLLRKTHIDELPQLWSILWGDLSLIGPRPELPRFVDLYEKEIPFYDVRHLIKPGLSGWAQLYHVTPPKREANTSQTRKKLSYDMYYIKNRSFLLDFQIAIKTIRTLVGGKGL